jgi:long-chain acyl-CoA synthetase
MASDAGAYGRIRTLADILPWRAESTPDKVALQELGPDGKLADTSFAELAGNVDAFAAHLREVGVRRGAAVSLLMRNSARWVIAYYAVFRAGAVAVPVERGMLETAPDRVRHAFDDAEACCVVCDREDTERVAELAGPGRCVVAAQDVDLATAPAFPRPRVKPDDLAQILYTSGTTGHRKGVELTHENVVFNVGKCCDRFGVTRDDCLPALLPYHHAYPLTTTVVLPAYAACRMAVGDVRDRRSRDVLRQCRPTVLVGVPRVFESMLDSVRSAAERAGKQKQFERARKLSAAAKGLAGLNVGRLLFRRVHHELFGGPQLRFCVSGGARISPRLLREFFLLGIPIVQGWGMSELSPVGAVQSFRRARFYFTRYYEKKAGSIGAPLDGTEVALAPDIAGPALEAADQGELVVKGPHVMRGYHKDPAGTSAQMTGDGIRSGDIARRDRDGDLYIIGRVKHVIVLPNGKKVFPEDDLEEELSRCPTIRAFAVRAIPDEGGAEKIGIVIQPDADALKSLGIRTLGEVYAAIKKEIDESLRGKPDHLRRYDFCLTPWQDGGYAELVSTAMGDPCPLKNAFRPEAAFSHMRDSLDPVPWR